MNTVLFVTERTGLTRKALHSGVSDFVMAITFADLEKKTLVEVRNMFRRRWTTIVVEVLTKDAAASFGKILNHTRGTRLLYLRRAGVLDDTVLKQLVTDFVGVVFTVGRAAEIYGTAINAYLSGENGSLQNILADLVKMHKILIEHAPPKCTTGAPPSDDERMGPMREYYAYFTDRPGSAIRVRNTLNVPVLVSSLDKARLEPGEEREIKEVYELCYRTEDSSEKKWLGSNRKEIAKGCYHTIEEKSGGELKETAEPNKAEGKTADPGIPTPAGESKVAEPNTPTSSGGKTAEPNKIESKKEDKAGAKTTDPGPPTPTGEGKVAKHATPALAIEGKTVCAIIPISVADCPRVRLSYYVENLSAKDAFVQVSLYDLRLVKAGSVVGPMQSPPEWWFSAENPGQRHALTHMSIYGMRCFAEAN